jgi:hypothetical protein
MGTFPGRGAAVIAALERDSRRVTAMAAMLFHDAVRNLAGEVAALEPDGKIMAQAAEDARAAAVEAVLLWRTAAAEVARQCDHLAQRRRAGGSR